MSDDVLAQALSSAARVQALVGRDMVLVGGAAAAFYAGHRASFDHVMSDLVARFDMVLDALEREGEWVTNRVRPGKIILGELGGIETGVRQLIRTVPLEFTEQTLPDGQVLRVPTLDETLRVKAFLTVKRNQVRDYLDVAALSALTGASRAGRVLSQIDRYYREPDHPVDAVASQVARQLAAPAPADSRTLTHLPTYKNLAPRWRTWDAVVTQCQAVADAMIQEP